MNIRTMTRRYCIRLLLGAALLAPVTAVKAAVTLELEAQIVDADGSVITGDTARVVHGVHESGRATAEDPLGLHTSSIGATFDQTVITTDPAFTLPPIASHLTVTWFTKVDVLLSNGGGGKPGVIGQKAGATHLYHRGAETHAMFAIPADAMNAVVLPGESHGIDWLRFSYSVDFHGWSSTQFVHGPGLSFSVTDSVPGFWDMVADINGGHVLIIDLVKWGLAPGEPYYFVESYDLVASLDKLVIVHTDPLSGTAIPEPASLSLLGLGGVALLLRRRGRP